MKTVEETKTGLPSFETEWPKKAETERETRGSGTSRASQRLHQMVESSIWDNTWRGIQGYDSPLAG